MADKFLKVTFEFNEQDMLKFRDLLKQSDVAAEDLDKNLKDIGKTSEQTFSQADKGINQLITGVKAFLALELVNSLKNAAIEASKVAAAGEGIRSAYGNLGLTTANLKDFRAAVGGTVSDLRLMQMAVSATSKGLGPEGLGKVLEYADKQADATGGSLEQLADIMINAIGKQSTKGLNQAGLSMQNIEKNASKMGFMPALFEEITRKSESLGEIASDAGDAYDQLAASQENLKEAFGRVVNSGPFKQLQAFVSGGLTKLADFLNDPTGNQAKFSGMSDQELVADFEKSKKRTEELEANYRKTRNPFKLSGLREDLETEKELRLAIIAEGQRRERQAEQDALREKNKLDEEALEAAEEEADKKLKLAKELAAEKILLEKQLNEALAQIEAERAAGLEISGRERDALVKAVNELPTFEDAIKFDAPETSDIDKDAPVELADTTKDIEKNLAASANSMFAIYDLMTGLGKEESGPQKFLKILSGILGIVGSIPGVGSGFGIAGSILGGIGARLNQGGVVPGGGPDVDSVHALLTPQEFVVKRRAAKNSAMLLEAINSEKINDKFLSSLLSPGVVVNVDQDKVVKAINSMPQIDFYKQGSVLFEARASADRMRQQRKARIIV